MDTMPSFLFINRSLNAVAGGYFDPKTDNEVTSTPADVKFVKAFGRIVTPHSEGWRMGITAAEPEEQEQWRGLFEKSEEIKAKAQDSCREKNVTFPFNFTLEEGATEELYSWYYGARYESVKEVQIVATLNKETSVPTLKAFVDAFRK